GRDRLDVVAELLQQPRGIGDGGDRLRVRVRVYRRGGDEADPQSARLATDLVRERALGTRGGDGADGIGADEQVEQRGAVADAAGDDAVGRGAVEALAVDGTGRDESAAGLEAEEAAAGGGDADRAATVAGARDRQDPGRDGRRRAAGGAAGRVVEV